MRIHPLITKSEDLKALVDRLSKQPFVAVDTEFMRENTYWPDLCLIQVASSEEAAAIDPKSQRIADNLELARAAASEGLPQRRAGESEADWAARLNDAGVIARVQGNNKKAIAAFTQAIEARSQYYVRAANNMAMVVPSR